MDKCHRYSFVTDANLKVEQMPNSQCNQNSTLLSSEIQCKCVNITTTIHTNTLFLSVLSLAS